MAKLWQKHTVLNELIEVFTIGNDPILDQALVSADCLGSMAHAQMLHSIQILNQTELDQIKTALKQLLADYAQGNFKVLPSDEDCHTAIENYLCTKIGDTGKKIHTGRSRNDQVIVTLRLYARSSVLRILDYSLDCVRTLADFAKKHQWVPMPGRTHMQTAMPSSVGLWAAAFAEEILDICGLLWHYYGFYNRSPLGSAASYGVPLPLDRELTAELLGFYAVQNNVLYVNNSRGKWEAMLADILEQFGLTLSKIAADLLLFSLPEFGYFKLPDNLCTGSSIMPQKKNPDGLELLRAKSATLSSCSIQIKSVCRSLPSGYNRDFQETKEPFLKALDLSGAMLRIMQLTIQNLSVSEDALRKAFTPEIFATDAAINLVRQGIPFREAYQKIGGSLESLSRMDPAKVIRERTSTGTTGNLGLGRLTENYANLMQQCLEEQKRLNKKTLSLLDLPEEKVLN